MTEWRDLPPPPDPDQPGWDRSELSPEAPVDRDDLGIAAVVLGCIGIVAFGIVLAIVTAVLGSVAGARARNQQRPLGTAYLALGLAALDGFVWLVMHYLFELPIWAG
ncbi:MAG: hypothetical protein QOG01_1134 [Pseudonocardiales bacterium]|jgi:hypothetical protein|nr:hypothetical protein [Pseudonocardiales bacterium]